MHDKTCCLLHLTATFCSLITKAPGSAKQLSVFLLEISQQYLYDLEVQQMQLTASLDSLTDIPLPVGFRISSEQSLTLPVLYEQFSQWAPFERDCRLSIFPPTSFLLS